MANNSVFNDSPYIIELNDVSKKFADSDVYAVENFNLKIKKGEFVTFLGPSGCGKTTTLRMIGGLEMPTSGQILLNGVDREKQTLAILGTNDWAYQMYQDLPVKTSARSILINKNAIEVENSNENLLHIPYVEQQESTKDSIIDADLIQLTVEFWKKIHNTGLHSQESLMRGLYKLNITKHLQELGKIQTLQ